MQLREMYMCAVPALALALAGCPSSPPEPLSDTGTPDGTGDAIVSETGPPDTGPELDGTTSDADGNSGGDADAGPSVPPTDFYYFSSGGGVTSSANFEARLSVGAPSPRGPATGDNYKLRLAPVSP